MSGSDPALVDYYGRRAPEFETVYAKPERQDDLRQLALRLTVLLTGRTVLELACGTGYWTEIVAPATKKLVATDRSLDVLHLARLKSYPAGRVHFALFDVYFPAALPLFDLVLAAFWWSHVSRGDLGPFLQSIRAQQPDASLVFVDNRFVEGSSSPLSSVDAEGNGYQQRTLRDGSRFEVLKNFPSAEEIRRELEPLGHVSVVELQYYWLAVVTPTGATAS